MYQLFIDKFCNNVYQELHVEISMCKCILEEWHTLAFDGLDFIIFNIFPRRCCNLEDFSIKMFNFEVHTC